MVPVALLVYIIVAVGLIWISYMCARTTGNGIGFIGIIICSIIAAYTYMFVGLSICPARQSFYPSLLLFIALCLYFGTTQLVDSYSGMEAVIQWAVVIVSSATSAIVCYRNYGLIDN